MCLLLFKAEFAIAAGPTEGIPVRVLTVTMTIDSLPTFLDHVRKFADANEFALRIKATAPDPTHILRQLWREDMKGILMGASGFNPAGISYSIALYRNCNDAVPDWAFDRVVSQLREAFSQIEGVTSIREE